MESLVLTVQELTEITGRIKSSAQVRWLRQHGFTVVQRADGRPIVSRAHFQAKMDGILPGTKPQHYEPNFGTL